MFRHLRPSLLVLSTLLTGLLPSQAQAVDREEACEEATTVTVNTTLHHYGSGIAELKIFKVTLASTGVLVLDAFSPGDQVDEPSLLFLGTTCEVPSSSGSDYTFIKQLPGSVAVEIKTDDTFYFQIAPEDPEGSLSGYKLRTTFLAELSSLDETTSPESDATDTCNSSSTALAEDDIAASHYVKFEQGVDEFDGDIIGFTSTIPGIVKVSGTGVDVSTFLYEGQACPSGGLFAEANLLSSGGRLAAPFHAGDLRLKVLPYQSSSGEYDLHVRVYDVCGEGESDDHGDSFLCASPQSLTSAGSGQLAATNDDDDDLYTFVLSAQKTVEVKSTGETDTFGSLYNSAGSRLGTANSGGGGPNFRIAQTLAAGRYYVRVEGKDGTEGSYGLSVTELEEP